MILDALKYIVGLGTPETIKIGDYHYSDRKLNIVEIPRIETVEVNTRAGFIDFANASKSKKFQFIHISDDFIKLMSKELSYSYRRECYCELKSPETGDRDAVKQFCKGFLIVM